jgi:glucan 1,3-beta-glucosidase
MNVDFIYFGQISPSQRGIVESPSWSYQLGLRGGWFPKDPRTALGTCGDSGPGFGGRYEPWMTGGVGAGVMQTSYAWPPASINLAPADPTGLPSYTPTGAISTLPPPTYTDSTGKPIVSGNGWFNADDNTPAPTPVAGCTYPDGWDALSAAVPAGCGFGAAGAVPSRTVSRITTPTRATTTTTTGITTTTTDVTTTTTDLV